jgi:hypothetical protein
MSRCLQTAKTDPHDALEFQISTTDSNGRAREVSGIIRYHPVTLDAGETLPAKVTMSMILLVLCYSLINTYVNRG